MIFKMDPWNSEPSRGNETSDSDDCNVKADSFEDNFKPTVSETLPDSKQYLEALESKLHKIKNDPNVLRQLAQRREACMQQLLRGEIEYNQDSETFDSPLNSSAFMRAVAPERHALTTGEVVELVKYDLLMSEEEPDNSDTASR